MKVIGKIIGKEELKDKKYKEVLDRLTPELAQAIETAAMETGIREDVFMELKAVDSNIESTLLYEFLIEHFYGPEWYELFGKILKEKENGENYLEVLKEISIKKKLSAADVEHIYQNTDSEYGFQKILEELDEDEKTRKAQEKPEKEQKRKDLEKISIDDSIYENFYQEVTKSEITVEKMDQHDQLMAAVINSNNEYKDMKNRLKEMDRMARMQNHIIIQYKNSVDSIREENEKLKADYEQLQNENETLKANYDLAMSRLTKINSFTAGNGGSKLFS